MLLSSLSYSQQFNLLWEKSIHVNGRLFLFGDFNNDKSLDFAYTAEDSLIIFDSNMHELYSTDKVPYLDRYLSPIDITGDGYAEVFASVHGGGGIEKIGIYDLIQKEFVFEYINKFVGSSSCYFSLVEDINGDGFIDIIISNADSKNNYDPDITLFFSTDVPFTKVNNDSNVQNSFKLNQNYPNPFNPSTTIQFSVPKTESVTLDVYDILGRNVTNLVNEGKTSGNYKVEFNGSNLSSGVYFYRLQAGNYSDTKKFLLLK